MVVDGPFTSFHQKVPAADHFVGYTLTPNAFTEPYYVVLMTTNYHVGLCGSENYLVVRTVTVQRSDASVCKYKRLLRSAVLQYFFAIIVTFVSKELRQQEITII